MDFRDLTKHKGVDAFQVSGPSLIGPLHIYEEVMKIVANKPKMRIIDF